MTGYDLFAEPEESDWDEVPAARFLSWSATEQFAYCAKRDYMSASEAESIAESTWFTERAQRYEEMSR